MSYAKKSSDILLISEEKGLPVDLKIEPLHGSIATLQEFANQCKQSCDMFSMLRLLEAAKTLPRKTVESFIRNDVLDNSDLEFGELLGLLRFRLAEGKLKTGLQPIVRVNRDNVLLFTLANVSNSPIRTKATQLTFCPIRQSGQVMLTSKNGEVVGDPFQIVAAEFHGKSVLLQPHHSLERMVHGVEVGAVREGVMQYMIAFTSGNKQYVQRAPLNFGEW